MSVEQILKPNGTTAPPNNLRLKYQQTPQRIIDFLANYSDAAKYLSETEAKKMKADFLQLEKKYIKKQILERQKQQELRKQAYQQQIKQLEHELIIKQQEEARRAQQARTYKAQQMEQEMRRIRDSTLTNQQKIAELQKLMDQLDAFAKSQ